MSLYNIKLSDCLFQYQNTLVFFPSILRDSLLFPFSTSLSLISYYIYTSISLLSRFNYTAQPSPVLESPPENIRSLYKHSTTETKVRIAVLAQRKTPRYARANKETNQGSFNDKTISIPLENSPALSVAGSSSQKKKKVKKGAKTGKTKKP